MYHSDRNESRPEIFQLADFARILFAAKVYREDAKVIAKLIAKCEQFIKEDGELPNPTSSLELGGRAMKLVREWERKYLNEETMGVVISAFGFHGREAASVSNAAPLESTLSLGETGVIMSAARHAGLNVDSFITKYDLDNPDKASNEDAALSADDYATLLMWGSFFVGPIRKPCFSLARQHQPVVMQDVEEDPPVPSSSTAPQTFTKTDFLAMITPIKNDCKQRNELLQKYESILTDISDTDEVDMNYADMQAFDQWNKTIKETGAAKELPQVWASRYDKKNQMCEICGTDKRYQSMILCDDCEGAWHLKCLDPPMKRVPKDGMDWCCLTCATKRFVWD
ncbi:hypothetical protein K491DRAFT_748571 [Lophiostoma macrostomum CBS 122681]|uniref:PHD-type domain-containing protein n=1 Tax=Lophiostoma macrostomum CBS 122681 TaxID=1314788 RepID=A0A6A6T4K9_9PLEO|nr:hypothetical protein K491DRAFT_748571 [Lophiostoma macrostomum CBS 122681]